MKLSERWPAIFVISIPVLGLGMLLWRLFTVRGRGKPYILEDPGVLQPGLERDIRFRGQLR